MAMPAWHGAGPFCLTVTPAFISSNWRGALLLLSLLGELCGVPVAAPASAESLEGEQNLGKPQTHSIHSHL